MTVLPTVTGLAYDAANSVYTVSQGQYGPAWTNAVGDTLALAYTIDATTGEHWGAVTYTSSAGDMYFGTAVPGTLFCHFSGPSSAVAPLPLCADWGISVDRNGASLALSNTPLYDVVKKSATHGTMSGVFPFPRF